MAMPISPPIYLPLLLLSISLLPHPLLSQCTSPPVIFNFGDSNSDTGGLVAGLGYPVNPPNGRSFFRRSTGRLSDGRLVIDFLGQSLNASLLRPYLDSLSGNKFTNGANFAIVGSSTLPKYEPFSLHIQVMQFLHFKSTSGGSLVNDQGFKNALYMIDIGQNDIATAFSFSNNRSSFALVRKRIPVVIGEIKDAIQTIYGEGGRKFWVHNTGPLGCLPKILSLTKKTPADLDRNGCLARYNAAARLFNAELQRLCQEMRVQYEDATIVYVDIYGIKYDLIANFKNYGFSNPLMACCGSGGAPYNFDNRVTCGQYGFQVCNEGSKYVNWDATHYTEAANSFVASRILSTAYSTPKAKFDFFCKV